MSEGSESRPEPTAGLARIPFSAADETTIRSLAGWMKAAAWIHLGLGVLSLLNAFVAQNAGPLFDAVLKIIIGAWTLQAATAFRQVANTDQADQDYLALGFRKLRALFLLQAVLVILGLVLVSVALLMFLVLAGPQRGPAL